MGQLRHIPSHALEGHKTMQFSNIFISSMFFLFALNANAMTVILNNGSVIRYSKTIPDRTPDLLKLDLPVGAFGVFSVSPDYLFNRIYVVVQSPGFKKGMYIYDMKTLKRIGFLPSAFKIMFKSQTEIEISSYYEKKQTAVRSRDSINMIEGLLIYGDKKIMVRSRKDFHILKINSTQYEYSEENDDNNAGEECSTDSFSNFIGQDRSGRKYYASKCYEYRGNRLSTYFDDSTPVFGSSINSFDLGTKVSQTNDILQLLAAETNAEPCPGHNLQPLIDEVCDSMACNRHGEPPPMCKDDVMTALSTYSVEDRKFAKKLGYVEIVGIFEE
jgi:hypothetical protein